MNIYKNLVIGSNVSYAAVSGTADLKFKDTSLIADWSKASIEALVAKGYLKGDDKGNVRPTSSLTRAEAVTLVNNV